MLFSSVLSNLVGFTISGLMPAMPECSCSEVLVLEKPWTDLRWFRTYSAEVQHGSVSAPWLSQAPVPCGQPGWLHDPDSSSVLLPPGVERCPPPNRLAKAEPDLLRTKARQRKWTHNKRPIYISLSVYLPRRLTVMNAFLGSRASPHLVQLQLLAADCPLLGTSS